MQCNPESATTPALEQGQNRPVEDSTEKYLGEGMLLLLSLIALVFGKNLHSIGTFFPYLSHRVCLHVVEIEDNPAFFNRNLFISLRFWVWQIRLYT